MLVVVSVGETQLFFLEDETSSTTRAVEICGKVELAKFARCCDLLFSSKQSLGGLFKRQSAVCD
jgi:hypothetical protein